MSDGSFTDDQVHMWLQEIADKAFVSLHYDNPALGGLGACEISGGGYRRIRVAFSDPTNRAIWSQEDIRFTGLIENQLTHYGIWNAANNGRLMAYAALPSKVVVTNGWGYRIDEGDLAVSMG